MYLLTKTCYIYKLDRKLFSEASGKNIAFDWILGYNKLNDKKKSDILKYHRYSFVVRNGWYLKIFLLRKLYGDVCLYHVPRILTTPDFGTSLI